MYFITELEVLIALMIAAVFMFITVYAVKNRSLTVSFAAITYYKTPILAFMALIAFTFGINYVFDSYDNALIYTFRAVIMTVLTITVITFFGTYGLSRALEGLVHPFSLFGVNAKRLSLVITLGITLIPVLVHDARQVRAALSAKGHKSTLRTIFRDSKIVLIPYFELVFQRLHAYENALRAKGV
jgi:energy-coupling factor transporter transmembrane protein EcfT